MLLPNEEKLRRKGILRWEHSARAINEGLLPKGICSSDQKCSPFPHTLHRFRIKGSDFINPVLSNRGAFQQGIDIGSRVSLWLANKAPKALTSVVSAAR